MTMVAPAVVDSSDSASGEDGRLPPRGPGKHAKRRTAIGGRSLPVVTMLAVALGAAILNVWWLQQYRAGLPYDIDEAGYLQRALLYGREITQHGPAGALSVLRRPDTVAPLLPMLSGSLHSVFGLSVFQMLQTQAIAYAGAIIAAYVLARSFTGPGWSLLVALMAAALPGLIDAGRLYLLAEPAAALFALTIAAQLRAKSFDSLPRTLVWGLTLGLTTLTRTMILGLLVGVGIAAVARLLAAGITRRRLINFAAGCVVAFLVAWTWYADSIKTVFSYLTTYGYGTEAEKYGTAHTPLSVSWWTVRLKDLLNQDLYLPMAVMLCLALGVIAYRFVRARRKLSSTEHGVSSPPLRRIVHSLLLTDYGILFTIVALGWLVLTSTSNAGSYFELPLAIPLVCLLVAPLGRPGGAGRTAFLVFAVAASGITLADQAGMTPSLAQFSSVQVGPVAVTAFNGRQAGYSGAKLEEAQLGGTYWSDCGGATYTCWYGRSKGITDSYLREWQSLTRGVLHRVEAIAHDHDRQPVVFVAYQGPLLNSNTLSLVAEQRGSTLPIGALRPPDHAHASLQRQLMAPVFGQPNLVLAGVAASRGHSPKGAGSPEKKLRAVTQLLHKDGFHMVEKVALPGQQPMGIWWMNR